LTEIREGLKLEDLRIAKIRAIMRFPNRVLDNEEYSPNNSLDLDVKTRYISLSQSGQWFALEFTDAEITPNHCAI
jgi:hypothetical protein